MELSFTHTGYRYLLSRLLETGYLPAAFEDAERLLVDRKQFVLLRHDIDFELAPALIVARIEAEMGLFSTWFLLVTSEHYNPFSPGASDTIRQLLKMGHRFGLHFDCAAYPGAGLADLNAHCAAEASLLEQWFGVDVAAVSIHRPPASVIGSDQALTAPRLHTYMPLFMEQMAYLADSRGLWRYGHPLEHPAFAQGKPLHLLIHPIWWRDEETTPVQTLTDFIDRRCHSLQSSVAANSTVYQPGK